MNRVLSQSDKRKAIVEEVDILDTDVRSNQNSWRKLIPHAIQYKKLGMSQRPFTAMVKSNMKYLHPMRRGLQMQDGLQLTMCLFQRASCHHLLIWMMFHPCTQKHGLQLLQMCSCMYVKHPQKRSRQED